jgi:hypothetical protein
LPQSKSRGIAVVAPATVEDPPILMAGGFFRSAALAAKHRICAMAVELAIWRDGYGWEQPVPAA